MWEALAAAAGSATGSLLGYIGQKETNARNATIADDANRAAQANAREQMQFQERMSNTTHAREVADLKNAGLNPILSANGGAPAPGGAAGGVQTPTMQNEMGEIATTMQNAIANNLAMKKQTKEIELMDSVAAKNRVDTKVAEKGIPESEIKNDAFDIMRPYLKKLKNALQNNAEKPKAKPNQKMDNNAATPLGGFFR